MSSANQSLFSWGPEDDGKTVDGPDHLASEGLRHGIDYGRNGYGSLYVVASGNGGENQDNCNFDGYANSIFTITIGEFISNLRRQTVRNFFCKNCAIFVMWNSVFTRTQKYFSDNTSVMVICFRETYGIN